MIKKAARAAVMSIGIALLLAGSFYSLVLNFNLGNYLPVIIGSALILICVFGEKIMRLTARGPAKYLRIFLTFLTLAIALLFAVTCVRIYTHSRNVPPPGKDALIVLGAGLRGDRVSGTLALRLDKALEYLYSNPGTIAVVSGGQGPDEWVTEASAMKKYMTARGIEGHRIIEEGRSTSTRENFAFSKDILDRHFKGRAYSVAYVTNDFHSLRADITAKKLNLDAESLAAPSLFYMTPNHYTREFMALLWHMAFDR